jgi:hypothetical protein
MTEPLRSDDPAADYADDPADLRPGRIDRVFHALNPLDFLFLALCPCMLFAPLLVVGATIGLAGCRSPRARRNAWLLLFVSGAWTVVLVGTGVAGFVSDD